MFKFLALAALLLSAPSFAQDDSGVADAGQKESLVVLAENNQLAIDLDAGVQSPLPKNEAAIVRAIYVAVKSGNWWLAGTALLILVVGLLRKLGKPAHKWLMQFGSGPWFYVNKIFWFFFDTKVGAWVMNWMTAVAGGLGTAWAAGSVIDHSIVKSVVIVSTSGTMLIELYKDIKEWWVSYKTRKATEAAAAAAALPKPPPPIIIPPPPGT